MTSNDVEFPPQMAGLGVDVVFVSEFSKLIADEDSVFIEKHFTKQEQSYCQSKVPNHNRYFAARFAAKEALLKAIESTTLFRPPLLKAFPFLEVEICHDQYSRPYFHFTKNLEDLIKQKNFKVLLSISHDGDYALAEVILYEFKL